MTKTIIVANRKGGVGKTTVATHLAAGMALLGLRVGIVDTDSQGHSAKAFGMPKENGLFNIMVNYETTFADVMRQVPLERYAVPGWDGLESTLFLLPSHKKTSRIPLDEPSPFRFRRILKDMAQLLELDYIVVDTGPTNSMFDGSIMIAADYYLYITECSALSFDGLVDALEELDEINKQVEDFRESPIEILGIQANKLRANTSNHRDNIKQLAGQFEKGVVWHPVTLRTVWEQAMEYGQLVYSYAPYGEEFRQAFKVVDWALKRLGEVESDSTFIKELMEVKDAS
jgi:chromosome partitioning protein